MGSSQNWTSFRGYLERCILGSFLKVNIQIRDIFFELQKFQIILELLDIPDFFFFFFFFFFFWGGGGKQ